MMYMMRVFFVMLIVLLPLKVQAEPLTIDLGADHVNITSSFSGTPLVLFGSVTEPGNIAVILEGPQTDSIVRRKEAVFGAWINRSWLRFEKIPSYYDYATTFRPADDSEDAEMVNTMEVLEDDFRNEKHLGLGFARGLHRRDSDYDSVTIEAFKDALLRNKQDRRLYALAPQRVRFISPTLFRADFYLPANVPSGDYTMRALLIRDGAVAYEQSKSFSVGLEGMNADIYVFAKDYSLLYGVLCVVLACFGGWLSGLVFRRN